ncbi:hypothetical protein [Streptomyces sp. 8N616]|uniref:hypothetical protein n=1 Tax=Streptomyces sp. 8N616 TaxID=3457414 RepID=UPI003FD234C5
MDRRRTHPLDAPVISTWSPGRRPAVSSRAPYAVVYVSQAAAPATASTDSGRDTTAVSGSTTRSAYTPCALISMPGPVITGLPAANSVTSSPTDPTTPAAS